MSGLSARGHHSQHRSEGRSLWLLVVGRDRLRGVDSGWMGRRCASHRRVEYRTGIATEPARRQPDMRLGGDASSTPSKNNVDGRKGPWRAACQHSRETKADQRQRASQMQTPESRIEEAPKGRSGRCGRGLCPSSHHPAARYEPGPRVTYKRAAKGSAGRKRDVAGEYKI